MEKLIFVAFLLLAAIKSFASIHNISGISNNGRECTISFEVSDKNEIVALHYFGPVTDSEIGTRHSGTSVDDSAKYVYKKPESENISSSYSDSMFGDNVTFKQKNSLGMFSENMKVKLVYKEKLTAIEFEESVTMTGVKVQSRKGNCTKD